MKSNLPSDHAEETMEEILASIRQIMDPAQNQNVPLQPSPHRPLPETEKREDNVLVLTKKITTPQAEQKETSSDKQRKEPLSPSSQKLEGKSPVLENLVASSLAPLLQDWLAKNLPNMVEKAVKEEFKKLLDPYSKSIR
ncbi:MAG: hypothetical protein A2977_03915 [Alphaproteobacteria bacterium RIFCSPLOWO2_01_FULL_45_8]|nr:MAG: hypothetical protein A2621_04805 [Alphaproteobacteria bacterium RIFCSPHIGHO2_01_FULL_41_14]OFW95663.1 MAG: hypothetical protein A2977_03915 [Alphaproteobacteria bacterium RIFCSPLOWO2_01_FULL_45_8]